MIDVRIEERVLRCLVVTNDSRKWAHDVFGASALGDLRRTKRLVDYAAREAERLERSTSAACRGDAAAAEGAYRFVRNSKVEPDAIAEGGFQATAVASQESRILLAIEDTTTLSFRHKVAEELGDLGGKDQSKSRGFWVHSVLLVDGDTEATIGLVHQQRWVREPEARRGSKVFRKPGEPKESEKWLLASECTGERMGPSMERVISVCDREADIFEYLEYKVDRRERFLVRSANDRATLSAETLWSEVSAGTKLGVTTIKVEQRGGQHGRRGRDVALAVRGRKVTLRRPAYLPSEHAETIELWAVHAIEECPEDSGAEPLEWLLLTSEPIADIVAAVECLRWYGLRWRIEEFHKAWKSGCGVEERRMQHADNLARVAVVLAFVVVRILQLNETVRINPDSPCDRFFSTDEWRCLWLVVEKSKPPAAAPKIQWALHAIARLGGWLDTKRTGRIGWEAMWKGWQRLMDQVAGYQAASILFDKM